MGFKVSDAYIFVISLLVQMDISDHPSLCFDFLVVGGCLSFFNPPTTLLIQSRESEYATATLKQWVDYDQISTT